MEASDASMCCSSFTSASGRRIRVTIAMVLRNAAFIIDIRFLVPVEAAFGIHCVRLYQRRTHTRAQFMYYVYVNNKVSVWCFFLCF